MALLSQTALAEPSPTGPHAGLARFSLLTGDLDRALHWASTNDDPELGLLRGQIYYDMGLMRKANTQLTQSLEGTRAHFAARLALAKTRLALGQTSEAKKLLDTIRQHRSDDTGQEAAYLLAEQARDDNQYDRAGRILADMPKGRWAAMGYLNLATAYAKIDRDPARSLISLRVASAMVKNSEEGAEGADDELRQRILVTAGYLALRNEDPAKAISFLNKVALDGFLAPEGLYFHGLAQDQRKNYRAAMQSWHRARKFPLAFPGAAEAWLGMARAYDESGYLGQSGEAYLAANSAFESELVALKKLIDQVQSKGGYQAMIQSARNEDVEWFLADSKRLTQPRIAYLVQFMQDPQSQQAVRRVATLDKINNDLKAHSRDLVVLASMLEHRLNSLANHNSGKQKGLEQQIEKLEKREKAARDHLAEAGDAEPKQGRLSRTLDAIDQSISVAKQSYSRLESRIRNAPERFRILLQRTRDAQDDIDARLRTTNGLRQRSEKELGDLLVAFLEDQSHQMEAHLDRSNQQLAHLYEHIAMKRAKKGREDIQ